jgi:hypothetical protein
VRHLVEKQVNFHEKLSGFIVTFEALATPITKKFSRVQSCKYPA